MIITAVVVYALSVILNKLKKLQTYKQLTSPLITLMKLTFDASPVSTYSSNYNYVTVKILVGSSLAPEGQPRAVSAV